MLVGSAFVYSTSPQVPDLVPSGDASPHSPVKTFCGRIPPAPQPVVGGMAPDESERSNLVGFTWIHK